MCGLIQGCGQRAVEDIWKVSLHLNFVLMNNHILLCLCSSVDLSRVLEMITGERRLLACLRINEDACAALMKLERGKFRRQGPKGGQEVTLWRILCFL